MEKYNGLERLMDTLGASKHERGRQKPRGWYATKRLNRKRKKLARRAQRGKR